MIFIPCLWERGQKHYSIHQTMLTEYERKVLSAYAEDYGVATMQDLINLTFSMKGLSLLTDFQMPDRSGNVFTWMNSWEYQKKKKRRPILLSLQKKP